jgi:hypothetical protein
MALLNFDATTVAPELPRGPIPAGVYLAQIIESDVVATKSGGEMLKLTLEVLDDAHKNRRIWTNINTRNPSADAERIGQSQLSALCHAVNVLVPKDSSMLHMIPVRVRVAIRPAGPDRTGVHREAQNEVKGYEAAQGGTVPASYAPQTPPSTGTPNSGYRTAPAPAATPPRATGAAPWARRATTAA